MPDFVNGDERCNNLMTIVFDCGTSKGNGNSKQEVCNLMQLFYAHYHFEDYTDKDVLEMMTFICEDIISSGNHKISSFGSIDGAFKALSPGFESIFEAHCDNNERRPFPKFIEMTSIFCHVV